MKHNFNILFTDDNSGAGSDGREAEKLLEQAKAELEETKQKLIDAEEWKDKYDELESQNRTELMKKLSASQKEFAKDLTIEKLRHYVKIALPAGAVDTDSGGTPSHKGETKLNDSEKAEAERMGLSHEMYILFKKQRQQRKEAKANGKH
jgi:predicted  nucleic acid-binding Zn-ribbon protein